jgi:hypothetical protein
MNNRTLFEVLKLSLFSAFMTPIRAIIVDQHQHLDRRFTAGQEKRLTVRNVCRAELVAHARRLRR